MTKRYRKYKRADKILRDIGDAFRLALFIIVMAFWVIAMAVLLLVDTVFAGPKYGTKCKETCAPIVYCVDAFPLSFWHCAVTKAELYEHFSKVSVSDKVTLRRLRGRMLMSSYKDVCFDSYLARCLKRCSKKCLKLYCGEKLRLANGENFMSRQVVK